MTGTHEANSGGRKRESPQSIISRIELWNFGGWLLCSFDPDFRLLRDLGFVNPFREQKAQTARARALHYHLDPNNASV
jgi:hypothetical protein